MRLARELVGYDDALRALRTHADIGFESGDERWKELQADLRAALDRLMEAATAQLQLGPP